jgi:hypothetical protein
MKVKIDRISPEGVHVAVDKKYGTLSGAFVPLADFEKASDTSVEVLLKDVGYDEKRDDKGILISRVKRQCIDTANIRVPGEVDTEERPAKKSKAAKADDDGE